MVNAEPVAVVGRPRKYSEYERLLTSLPRPMKRPSYINNIGILKGIKRDSAYIKLCMTNGGVYGGKTYGKGDYIEVNLGKLSSFTWKQLEERLNELQGKADRGEPLEETPIRWTAPCINPSINPACTDCAKSMIVAITKAFLIRIATSSINAAIAIYPLSRIIRKAEFQL